MKKSTRALAGMVVLDALIAAGAAWMVWQTRSGDWNTPDPAATITEITRTAGGAIGIVSAVLLVAFVVWRRRGIRCLVRCRTDQPTATMKSPL